MASVPYMPLYVDDYEADTAHLSMLEDGVYSRLLRLCWRTPGCSVPDDEAWLFRRLRAQSEEERAAVLAIIEEFFERKAGRITSPRLVREFKKVDETTRKRSEAGKRGGRPQGTVNKQKDEKAGFCDDKAGPKQPEPEPEPEAATQLSAQPQAGDAKSEGASSDDLLDAVMHAVGLTNGRIPTYWMPPASTIHVERWRSELGLSQQEILSVARENRKQHDSAPNGPKALDAAMKRMADAKKNPIEAGQGRVPTADPLDAMCRKLGVA